MARWGGDGHSGWRLEPTVLTAGIIHCLCPGAAMSMSGRDVRHHLSTTARLSRRVAVALPETEPAGAVAAAELRPTIGAVRRRCADHGLVLAHVRFERGGLCVVAAPPARLNGAPERTLAA